MKVKSNFLSKSTKAFGIMAMCGMFFTSCYEKDEVKQVTPPASDPTYAIVGDVTNYLGEAVNAKITLNGADEKTGSSFSYNPVTEGDYTVSITAEGYQAVTKYIVAKNGALGTHTNYRADAVMALATYKPVYKIEGVITDKATGAAIKDAKVNGVASNNGVYSISDLAGGSYILTIEAANYPTQKVSVELSENAVTSNAVINKVMNFEMTKEVATTFSVAITAEDPSVLFVIKKMDGTTGVEVANGLGSYNGSLPAGIYSVEAFKDGVRSDSRTFTLGAEGNAVQSFAWALLKDKNSGTGSEGTSVFVPVDPATGKTIGLSNQAVKNEAGDAVSKIIESVSFDLAEGALEAATALNVSIIPINTAAEMAETAPVLTFRGTPSGTKFTTPLKVKFEDKYDLGDMSLFYLEGGAWNMEGEANSIKSTTAGFYEAEIPHFSDFMFGFKFSASKNTGKVDLATGEGKGVINESTSSREVTATYQVFKGAKFATKLEDELKDITKEPLGIALVKGMIQNLIRLQYGVTPNDEFETESFSKKISIPAQQALTAATASQEKTIQTYQVNFSKNNTPYTATISVEIAGTSVLNQTFSSIKHGSDDWNAGGGITITE